MSVVTCETRDGVGYMTFNRPQKHNALNAEMLVRMADAWKQWADRDDVRVVIVTGAGEKAFCAGGDLESAIPLLTGSQLPANEWDSRFHSDPMIQDCAMLRSFFPKPVIAAVNGICVAGGMEFMLGTDIRIACEAASFGLPEVRHGLIPAAGSLTRLTRQIPFCTAMELLLTGRSIGAADARALGLINRVVPTEQLMPAAEDLARAIIRNAPLAVKKVKEVAIATSGHTLEDAFAIESAAFAVIANSADAREGPLAFVERREPRYLGR
jgi:enoyl-CoA hydratase